MVSIVQGIKNIIFWEKDKDFFDKEATIKEYFAVCPPEKRRHVDSYEELYLEALKYVSKQNFADNTKEQEDYFYEMTKLDASIAILTGVVAYAIAYHVDKNGKKIEKGIDKILPEGYDVNNPFDIYDKGGKHRNYFGHDIFSFGLKNIPNDFELRYGKMGGHNMALPIGKIIDKDGDISMLDIIWHFYGKDASNPIAGIFNCAGHTIVHFAKDLLTSEGVPLPFVSLFYEYMPSYDMEDQEGEIISRFKNFDINKEINKVNGNMKASDFATLGFIEGMCKLYSASKKLGKREKSFNRDLKILSMGTCIMIQMSSLIIGQYRGKNAKGIIPGAKLNVIMTGALLKNMTQEMAVVVKARHEVNAEYDKRLKALKGDE